MTFFISASKLNSFFSCPAQYDYGRRLAPLTKDMFLEDGSAAHRLLAKELPGKLTPRARSFYEQLKLMYDEKGYAPLWVEEGKLVVEKKQLVTLYKGVKLVRVIDAFATVDGEYVLIDWKTAVWPWRGLSDTKSPLGGPVPAAMGFQATAYLMPPDDPAPFPWPTRIDFLVASERGGMGIHTYRRNEEDEANLIEAVKQVKATKVFPKHRSSSCFYCQFKHACFETPGWERLYEAKGKVDHAKDSNK